MVEPPGGGEVELKPFLHFNHVKKSWIALILMKCIIFWHVTLCGLMEVHRHFGEHWRAASGLMVLHSRK
jgi:hypothetical protein